MTFAIYFLWKDLHEVNSLFTSIMLANKKLSLAQFCTKHNLEETGLILYGDKKNMLKFPCRTEHSSGLNIDKRGVPEAGISLGVI